ncbi:DUF2235 domain-containing protein [Mucilaginibacter calamicampi]|uniref:DUF2235 domain-containing protein n=1 Tax=Mucilaginibacter calamicampi TaxID=1302352 RepID=A0ABW2Z167_9SPHI
MPPKRIITCSDGTWDKPGDKDKDGKPLDSNVCLLYNAIAPVGNDGVLQLKAYETGVGSSYSLRDKLLGGGIGLGIDQKIKNLYSFLVMSYEPGDELYLFGFSRGAYTARSLAGFIRTCGILKPNNLHLVDRAYELYRDRNDYTEPQSDLMTAFRRNYSQEDITRIKFIGVWDTVGALGIPLTAWRVYNFARYRFHDVKLSSTIDYAYHALAIDERRKPFDATLWEASTNTTATVRTKDMEQRWFAGVHCDVGGGYEERGLSNGPLHWLVRKAVACGLVFDESKLSGLDLNPLGVKHNSFIFLYWFTGKLWRKIEDAKYPNQVIDESVFERLEKDKTYRPANLKKYFPRG